MEIKIVSKKIAMSSPFKYGKIVTGDNFINRTEDIKRIQNNIAAGINTILISPRRWGKSSLIKQLSYLNKDKVTRYAFIHGLAPAAFCEGG